MLTHLKSKINFPKLVEKLGFKLYGSQENPAIHCPFHPADSTPSFKLKLGEKGWFGHCFGCGITCSPTKFFFQHSQTKMLDAFLCTYPDILDDKPLKQNLFIETKYFNDKATVYNLALKEESDATLYLKTRGFDTYFLQSNFCLGYSSNPMDYFYRYITFPIYDQAGHVVEFYGRSICSGSKTPHLYSPGQHRGVWNWEGIQNKTVIFTECIMDALSVYKCGFHNVSALYGVNGLTKLHIELLNKFQPEEIIFLFDNDATGKSAREHYHYLLGHTTDLYLPDKYKDVNEFLMKDESGLDKFLHTALDKK